jgi:hypothetical protein
MGSNQRSPDFDASVDDRAGVGVFPIVAVFAFLFRGFFFLLNDQLLRMIPGRDHSSQFDT